MLAVYLVRIDLQILLLTLISVRHLTVHSVTVTLLALPVEVMMILASEGHYFVHLIPTYPLDQEEVLIQVGLDASQVSTESLIRKECSIKDFRMAITVTVDYKGTILKDHLTHMVHQVKEVVQEDLLIHMVYPVKDSKTTLLLKVININTRSNDIYDSV